MWKNMSKILGCCKSLFRFMMIHFVVIKPRNFCDNPAIESNDVRLGFIPDRDQREIFSRFRLSLVGLKIVVITREHVCTDQKHSTIHVQKKKTHKK